MNKIIYKRLQFRWASFLLFFAVVMFVLGAREPQEGARFNFSVDQATVVIRFVFVVIGLLIAFAVYYATKAESSLGSGHPPGGMDGDRRRALRSVLICCSMALSLFVPSVSQVALRPAIAIPMFFGYAFGPVVGFFTGAVGNMFGDALTGFGLSPQWSIGNGLVGFISGLWMLFPDRKKSMNTVLWVSGVLAALTALLYFLNRNQPNMLFFDPDNNIFGDAPITLFAGIAILIGFLLVLGCAFLLWHKREYCRRCNLGHARQHPGFALCRAFRYLDQRFHTAGHHRRSIPAGGWTEPDLCRDSGSVAGCRVQLGTETVG